MEVEVGSRLRGMRNAEWNGCCERSPPQILVHIGHLRTIAVFVPVRSSFLTTETSSNDFTPTSAPALHPERSTFRSSSRSHNDGRHRSGSVFVPRALLTSNFVGQRALHLRLRAYHFASSHDALTILHQALRLCRSGFGTNAQRRWHQHPTVITPACTSPRSGSCLGHDTTPPRRLGCPWDTDTDSVPDGGRCHGTGYGLRWRRAYDGDEHAHRRTVTGRCVACGHGAYSGDTAVWGGWRCTRPHVGVEHEHDHRGHGAG